MHADNENEWLDVLRAYRKQHGGARTADAVGYSTTVISQVLQNKYPGTTDAVRQKVEGALMGKTVDCPVVGDLPRNRCLEYQRQQFAATNPMRVRLARTCPTCPNRRGAE